MTSSWISGKDEGFDVHSKLAGLIQDPDVGLEAIIDAVWVGVFGCKSIVDAEDRNSYFISPLACVELMWGRIHADKASTMEVDNGFFYTKSLFLWYLSAREIHRTWPAVEQSHFNMSCFIM